MAVLTDIVIESAISLETHKLAEIERQIAICPFADISQLLDWKVEISGIRKRIRDIVSDYCLNKDV